MRPSLAKQKSFRRKYGDGLVVFVDPARVELHAGSKWPIAEAQLISLERRLPKALVNVLRPTLKNREPFVVPRSYFVRPKTMGETSKYRKIEEFIQHDGNVEDTLWFKELLSDLQKKGKAHHKNIVMRNTSDIRDFFANYVTPLIESLRRDGFKPEATGYESSALVDADGRLIKVGSGNHRFAMCQILGLPSFPLRVVGVHEDWYAREVMPHGDTWESFQAALARVAADHQ